MNCIFVLYNLQIINETLELIFETRLSIRHVSEFLNYVDVFEQVLSQHAYQLNYFPRVMRPSHPSYSLACNFRRFFHIFFLHRCRPN